MIGDLQTKRVQELLSLKSFMKGKLKQVDDSLRDMELRRASVISDIHDLETELTSRKANKI